MSNRRRIGYILATLVLVSAPAASQQRGQILLYSETNFQGRMLPVSGTREAIGLSWTVRSVQVAPGEAWDLCQRTRFRSPCHRVAQNSPNVRWRVASARPSLAQTLPEPVPPVGGSQSLRGMSAEFFPAPSDGRGRVESCRAGTAACAQESANRFCRQRGWTAASYSRQETVGGTNFLADVLCTRTGA